jgi:hypothetical protein
MMASAAVAMPPVTGAMPPVTVALPPVAVLMPRVVVVSASDRRAAAVVTAALAVVSVVPQAVFRQVITTGHDISQHTPGGQPAVRRPRSRCPPSPAAAICS